MPRQAGKPRLTGINLPLSITKSKEEISISEEEFVKRRATHILPKRFMRVQHCGATSRRKGTVYLAQCRKILGTEDSVDVRSANAESAKPGPAKSGSSSSEDDPFELIGGNEEPAEKPYEPKWKCTSCGKLMDCIEFQLRPSGKVISKESF